MMEARNGGGKASSSSSSSHKKLDSEFRKILKIIKPYIQCIDNNFYLSRYRVWLEKLSATVEWEKKLRNAYLAELCRQIQAGILEEPFVQAPPLGPLVPFQGQGCRQARELTEMSVDYSRMSQVYHCYPVPTCRTGVNSRASSRTDYHQQLKLEPDVPTQDFPYTMGQLPVATTEHINTKNSIDKKFARSPDEEAPTKNNFRVDRRDAEDSSWCDLTDMSSAIGDGDGDGDENSLKTPRSSCSTAGFEGKQRQNLLQDAYERKIAKLLAVVKDLKAENTQLHHHVAKYGRDIGLRNTKAETSIHNLAGEVHCLKNRLQELVDIKSALKDTSLYISVDWKNRAEHCQAQLEEAQQKNGELKAFIGNLEKRMREIEVAHQREKSAVKKRLAELHEKEVEMLKQSHLQTVSNLERDFQQRAADLERAFCERSNEMKKNYECKVAGLEAAIGEKDLEIRRLENLVEKQCSRMQKEVHTIRTQIEGSAAVKNEAFIDKIVFLQRCVSKMEKLYQKSEKDHHREVAKLRRELEMRDKSRQIQLTTQRAELMASNSTQRQTEIDAVVKGLEERYKNLLETQKWQVLVSAKNNDDEKVLEDARMLIDQSNK